MTEPKITFKNGHIIIDADLDAEGGKESSTGKTLVLASTHGNQKVQTDDGEIFVGLNIYRKK